MQQAACDTLRTTGMIFGILFGALVFSAFVTVTPIRLNIVAWVTQMSLPPLAGLMIILLVAGLGYDAVLFGLPVVRMMKTP